MLKVLKNYAGKGVYATQNIRKGTKIESSPVLLLKPSEYSGSIDNYVYSWGRKTVLAFGLGSMFNHSFESNAEFEENEDDMTLDFFASRNIKKGEEICINYNYQGELRGKSYKWYRDLSASK